MLRLTARESLAQASSHVGNVHLNLSNRKLKQRTAGAGRPASSFYGVQLPVLISLVTECLLADSDAVRQIAQFCTQNTNEHSALKVTVNMPHGINGHGFSYLTDRGFERFECMHVMIVLKKRESACRELFENTPLPAERCVYAKTFYPVP